MAPTSCHGNRRFWISETGVSRCATPMRRRSIMKTRPRKRHMLSTCSVRKVPKKLGASSRRYMLPGSVDTHSKKPWNGGGHISRLDSRHAAFFDADLRPADADVGPV